MGKKFCDVLWMLQHHTRVLFIQQKLIENVPHKKREWYVLSTIKASILNITPTALRYTPFVLPYIHINGTIHILYVGLWFLFYQLVNPKYQIIGCCNGTFTKFDHHLSFTVNTTLLHSIPIFDSITTVHDMVSSWSRYYWNGNNRQYDDLTNDD